LQPNLDSILNKIIGFYIIKYFEGSKRVHSKIKFEHYALNALAMFFYAFYAPKPFFMLFMLYFKLTTRFILTKN